MRLTNFDNIIKMGYKTFVHPIENILSIHLLLLQLLKR